MSPSQYVFARLLYCIVQGEGAKTVLPAPQPACPSPYPCFLWHFLFTLFFFLIFYLFLVSLGLCWCTRAFSSFGEQGLLSSCGAQVSHCGGFSCFKAQALGHAGFTNCGLWAQYLQLTGSRVLAHELWCMGSVAHGLWHLPEPGIKLVFLALQGGFLTTGSPGKPSLTCLVNSRCSVMFTGWQGVL